MRVAEIEHGSLAEGPGSRTVVWFQGCPIRCPGCYNRRLWPFDGGRETSVEEVLKEIQAGIAGGDTGVSLVGGEPLAQPEACAALCAALRDLGVHTIVYTGLVYEDVLDLAQTIPAYQLILDHADVLVDGPFVPAEYDPNVAYRGSRNQRVIDLRATRARGCMVTLEWDEQFAIVIRPDGSMTMPANLARLFDGRKTRARNCGEMT